MKLTEAFKKWLQENCDVKEDATDEEYRKAAGEALAEGKLTAEKLTELSTTADTKAANQFGEKLDLVVSSLSKLTEVLTPKPEETKEEKSEEPAPAEKMAEPNRPDNPLSKKVGGMGGTPDEPDEKEFDVRVKEAAEQYDNTKSALLYPATTRSGRAHPLAGRPVFDFSERGRTINTASDRDKAISGAYVKFLCATAQRGGSRTFGYQSLPDHDKELLQYALHNERWVGSSEGGDYEDINGKLSSGQQKALIDDATSGGIEAAPIVFDDQVIQAPLLHGELFPLVNTVPLDRGRRVEGVSTGTVTGAWGGVDDTAISLFSTTSYVSAFDTTIYRWEGAIRIGLDFLSDTPIDFGAHITAQYGERLLEDLDDVVAVGNGTTQPEGVINKSGATSVAFGGATSIGNYESLRFSVAKAEHRANVASSAVFCGTETSYQRVRALAVGASDNRRLFGMDHFDQGAGGYTFGGAMYKINESLANTQIFYAILARYRMYRRRGLTMRTSTEGDTLIRRNEMLMVAMARFGGQMERAAACAITTTAPA